MQRKHLGETVEGQKSSSCSRRTDRLHDEQDPFSLKTNQIMEAVVEAPNLRRALARVKGNNGSAGVDKMTVEELRTGSRLRSSY